VTIPTPQRAAASCAWLARAVARTHAMARARGAGAHVLAIEIRDPRVGEIDSLAEWLQDDEQERMRAFRDPMRAATYATAHAALRLALAAETGAPAEGLRIMSPRPGGKPFLAGFDRMEIDFSVSHAESICLIGIRRSGCIGVDVERVDPLHPLLRVSERLCGPHERLRAGDAAGVFSLWTRKEAWLKAEGLGLSRYRPRDLDLVRVPGGGWKVAGPPASAAGSTTYDYQLGRRCRAAACLSPAGPRPLAFFIPSP